ncbi:MAG: amino acid adenylation domain-containing protein [Acidobacteriota bacterium]|nr:amino acid adenylation domain-containing protein [Acidobacteriota bacterium]
MQDSGSFALSPVQEGMLFNHLTARQSGVDVEQIVVTLPEKLDAEAFRRAWQKAVDLHGALRTGFDWESRGEPFQFELIDLAVPFEKLDWRDSEDRDRQLIRFLNADRLRGFDLRMPPPMRITLIEWGERDSAVVWTFHHIVIDGRSFVAILEEVFAIYQAGLRGERVEFPAPVPFRRYIDWLSKLDRTGEPEFWREKLKGITAPTPLPLDRDVPPPSAGEGAYGEEWMRLPFKLSDSVRQLAEREKLTLNIILMACWAILLNRYSGEDDVLFGATKSARRGSAEGAESIVGLLLNTIPVRAATPPDASFAEWARELRANWIGLRRFEHTPLVRIKAASEILAGVPLFESLVVVENSFFGTDLRKKGGNWSIRDFSLHEQTDYPITVLAYGDQEILLKIEYDRRKFFPLTAARMLGHIRRLLEQLAANPHLQLARLEILTAEERNQIVVQWNATQVDYPRDLCLHELIERQVEKTPDNLALIAGEITLSYRELNARANQLARYLRAHGAGPEKLVAVCMERSAEMVISLLASLKAGAAYMPLDPDFPRDRLGDMLEDARPPVLLTQARLFEKLPSRSVPHVLALDTGWDEIAKEPDTNFESGAGPENIAYAIYTSGSTGKPKGVLNIHVAIVNRLLWMQDAYPLTGADRVLQKTPYSFDVSVWEFFWPFLTGASLIVAPPGAHKEPEALATLIAARKITTLHFVPSMLQVFLQAQGVERCTSIRRVICSGEALSLEAQTQFFAKLAAELHNLYGPTEAAVDVTYWECRPDSKLTTVPIGKPIANIRIYLLDPRLQPVPVGVAGELHIGGIGLARGYLNRPELTAERFIPDPFDVSGNGRLYKTGDLSRFLPDGNIEYLGRMDHQVKIRGLRIELGEIEHAIAEFPGVRNVVAIAREVAPGDKRLIAYVVSESAGGVETSALRAFLRKTLPEYMVPSSFVAMDEIPLSSNGKIDRKRLPDPSDLPSREASYAAPRDRVEKQLAEIWAEVLGLERVGIRDNFFELGGHSLLAVKLFSKMMLTHLPLGTLLSSPTIEQFVAAISRPAGAYRSLLPLRRSGTRLPFFCVHGAGGNVLSHRNLAYYMPPDQPFYSFQARGLDGGEHAFSIENTAAHYIAEIKTVQPNGPYHIGGGSFGGIVAFEMARQLEAAGDEVGLLALLDTYNFTYGQTISPAKRAYCYARFFSRKALRQVGQLAGVPLRQWPSHLREKLDAARNVIEKARAPKAIDTSDIHDERFVDILDRVRQANVDAARRYVPKFYPGRVSILKAAIRLPEPFEDPNLGWGPVVGGGFEMHEIPGDHEGIGVEPSVQILAGALYELLCKAKTRAISRREASALTA